MPAGGSSLRFGGGYLGTFGAIIPLGQTAPLRFELQPSIGYQFEDDFVEGGKDRISFHRVPIELLYFANHVREGFRVGYGVTYHSNAAISGKGKTAGFSADVDPATGYVFAIEKTFPGLHDIQSSIGLKYVSIRYASRSFTSEADGSGWLLTFSYFDLKKKPRVFD